MTSRRVIAGLATCALLLGLLAGCASAPPEKWEGRKIDEAIAAYGPPTKVTPSDAGKLYVWVSRHTMQGMGGFPGATRETHVTRRMMTVNPDGVITSYNLVDQ
ncbi:MAG: hypothetical protein PHQ91_06710 [Thermoanaerobaculaceae bacterium]|nr:hypothetical protein [Thermoanaerobaculaceae bacterium]TAM44291.1 MAG: hypothetical protein EPN53_16555 [Acidobacteriota bacterium]